MDFKAMLDDYAQLKDAYHNANKFFAGLMDNLKDANEKMQRLGDPNNPEKFNDAMNLVTPMGIAGTLKINPGHEFNPLVFKKWLQDTVGLPTDIANSAMKIHQKVVEHDAPGSQVFDPTKRLQGAQFQSDDMPAHILRIVKGVYDMARSLNLKPEELQRAVAATTTHDAGKGTVPRYVMWRTLEKNGQNFPLDFSKLPSPEELVKYPDGDYKKLMTDFFRFNKGDMNTISAWSNFTAKDKKLMDAHNSMSDAVGRQYDMPADLTNEGMLHHLDYDGLSGYPNKLLDLGLKKKQIPESGRISSIVDAFDAIVSPRYGGRVPSLENSVAPDGREIPGAIKMLETRPRNQGGGTSYDTQFDPDLLTHFIESGLAEQYYKTIANKVGPDLEKLFIK